MNGWQAGVLYWLFSSKIEKAAKREKEAHAPMSVEEWEAVIEKDRVEFEKWKLETLAAI
jgi:hypothetical protein